VRFFETVFRCVIIMSVCADGWLLVELGQYCCARPDDGTVGGEKDPMYASSFDVR